jgi:hypothetical protein
VPVALATLGCPVVGLILAGLVVDDLEDLDAPHTVGWRHPALDRCCIRLARSPARSGVATR